MGRRKVAWRLGGKDVLNLELEDMSICRWNISRIFFGKSNHVNQNGSILTLELPDHPLCPNWTARSPGPVASPRASIRQL